MKEVKYYVCDICHTEYNSKHQCQECEKYHRKTGRIERCHYISVTQNKAGYPHKIDIKFDDGQVLIYKRG